MCIGEEMCEQCVELNRIKNGIEVCVWVFWLMMVIVVVGWVIVFFKDSFLEVLQKL